MTSQTLINTVLNSLCLGFFGILFGLTYKSLHKIIALIKTISLIIPLSIFRKANLDKEVKSFHKRACKYNPIETFLLIFIFGLTQIILFYIMFDGKFNTLILFLLFFSIFLGNKCRELINISTDRLYYLEICIICKICNVIFFVTQIIDYYIFDLILKKITKLKDNISVRKSSRILKEKYVNINIYFQNLDNQYLK